ncbi:hypothetical protein COW46_01120 [Candidatus Gracilibacteria bacterium CG17_big_fil_post_rev_8_21_14_2_50_48_13]|nr:MAG: hypothetical protein COW46_01120 [Candidatus Gracilibacteria bacterium CG17_big_fil_post_rev_8_21_14_2_50_48_13]
MFCIAAFLVFLLLGIFSLRYRRLAVDAWNCVLHRVTFRPCDSTFRDDVRGMVAGSLMKRSPRLAAYFLRWADLLAWIFVLLSLWSLLSVMVIGLNLWIYDTCDPNQSESCSLGGEACSIGSTAPGFLEAAAKGELLSWSMRPFTTFADTVSRIPDRLKTWQAEDYLSPTATYRNTYNPTKPTALEIIDPGCVVCRKLTGRIKETDFATRYNLTYIAYAIPDGGIGTKFPFSGDVVRLLEAVKLLDKEQQSTRARDWEVLDRIFETEKDEADSLQNLLNTAMTPAQAESALRKVLQDTGFTEEEIRRIDFLRSSEEVSKTISAQRAIVEEQVRTKKIPTVLFDGRRFDRLPDLSQLQ